MSQPREQIRIPSSLRRVLIGALRLRLSRWLVVEAAALCPRPTFLRAAQVACGFQLDPAGVGLVASVIRAKRGSRLLVFGAGNDSLLWARLNRGGRTVFIEDNRKWYDLLTARHSKFEIYLVHYATRKADWKELLDKPHELELALPESVVDTAWDVVLVDGPKGWKDSQPGRMKSIYTAAQLVRRPGHVFVDDANREVESVYADRFLGASNRIAEAAGLRQFAVG